MEGRMPGSEGAANSNGQSPDEELWNRPSHVHKNYKESKDQAEALTYFDRGEKKNFASLCLENLHAKKLKSEAKYFGEKGAGKEWRGWEPSLN